MHALNLIKEVVSGYRYISTKFEFGDRMSILFRGSGMGSNSKLENPGRIVVDRTCPIGQTFGRASDHVSISYPVLLAWIERELNVQQQDGPYKDFNIIL